MVKKKQKNNILCYLGVDFEFLKTLMKKMVSVLEKKTREKKAKVVSVLLMTPKVYGNSTALRP